MTWSILKRALELRSAGLYTTDPNHALAAWIADHERVLGEGWHMRAGEAARGGIRAARAGIAGTRASVYVTLSHCSHTGRNAAGVPTL